MEDPFKKVVEHIFNNWTALKLAVDHSMAGSDSKTVALECMNYMVQYCLQESEDDVNNIEEALDDIMDQEFDTICEDGSTKEIALILHKFLQLTRSGNVALLEEEYQKLPTNPAWLVNSHSLHNETSDSKMVNSEESNDEANDSSEVPMEEEAGWTQVKSRRKK